MSFKAIFAVGARPLDQTRVLNPTLQTFEQCLAANKANIPLN